MSIRAGPGVEAGGYPSRGRLQLSRFDAGIEPERQALADAIRETGKKPARKAASVRAIMADNTLLLLDL